MKESLGSFWDEWEKETELEEKKLKEMQDKIHKHVNCSIIQTTH